MRDACSACIVCACATRARQGGRLHRTRRIRVARRGSSCNVHEHHRLCRAEDIVMFCLASSKTGQSDEWNIRRTGPERCEPVPRRRVCVMAGQPASGASGQNKRHSSIVSLAAVEPRHTRSVWRRAVLTCDAHTHARECVHAVPTPLRCCIRCAKTDGGPRYPTSVGAERGV